MQEPTVTYKFIYVLHRIYSMFCFACIFYCNSFALFTFHFVDQCMFINPFFFYFVAFFYTVYCMTNGHTCAMQSSIGK